MRLYHAHFHLPGLVWPFILLLLGTGLLLGACSAPQISPSQTTITIQVDGQEFDAQVPSGSTVQDALAAAGVTVNPLDRASPPFYTLVTDGTLIVLTRVQEEFSQPVDEVIPFERKEVRSESLPEGQMMLSQKGVNGIRRIVYRRLYEEGQQISVEEWESVIVEEPVPEIVLIGIGQTFTPTDIPGRIAYLMGGNAWVIEVNTGIRRLVVDSADLDGHIFKLSPDRRWLLFTRRSQKPGEINTLWLARVDDEGESTEVEIGISNIIHFADFRPQIENNELISYYTLGYSTVEPRSTAPGWQANNDLYYLGSNPATAYTSEPVEVIESNSGGVYGWWGTSFAWGPDGSRLAYASPDAVGIVGLDEDHLTPLLPIAPLETGSDWAWVPGISWSPDGSVLYTVVHDTESESTSPDRSPLFDLVAVSLIEKDDKLSVGTVVPLVRQVGMFAYPSPSPQMSSGHRIAYLEAISPRESESSLYRLAIMDRDGSDQHVIFPSSDARGIEPQQVVWSPSPMGDNNEYKILLVYQGNLWLIDHLSGEAQQLTSDGLTNRVDWK